MALEAILRFLLSALVLALFLFLPVSKLAYSLGVGHAQRRLGRAPGPQELDHQLSRARLVALAVIIAATLLFNLLPLGGSDGG